MKADLEQDAEGVEEAQKSLPAADGSHRPRDKYGRAPASVVAGTVRALCVVLTWVARAAQLRTWTRSSVKNSSGASRAGRRR